MQAESIFERIITLNTRVLEPGWQKIKCFFNVIETGGFVVDSMSYVYYPEHEPNTFTAGAFDENGEMLEKTDLDYVLDLWELQKDDAPKWYAATLVAYPDKTYEFIPSYEGELRSEEIFERQEAHYLP